MLSIENNQDGSFENVAMPAGIGMSTRWMSGWGLKFFDYDNDGDLDLILSNGFPDDLIEDLRHQSRGKSRCCFPSDGNAFRNVSTQSGPVFARRFAARGLAIGDFNNDGALDVLISNNDAAPLLLRNNVGDSNHWLGVTFGRAQVQPRCGRCARPLPGGRPDAARMKVGGGSFLSSHDPRLVLGMGRDRNSTGWK